MATYYWRGLSNANWSIAGNWSTGSTSTLGGAVPTNVDDAIFDINSSACTVNVTTAQTRSINFTTYTRTITMTNNIAIGANGGSNAGVTLGPSMGIAGTGALNILTANSTLTSNGRIWPNTLNIGSNLANSNTWCTIADVWNQYGNIGLTSGALAYGISGSGRIDFYGSRIFCTGRLQKAGSVKLVILSACTFSGTHITSASIELPIDFSAGTNTVTVGNLNITNTNWKYYSGNVVVETNTNINLLEGTTTFDMDPVKFYNLRLGLTFGNIVVFNSLSPTNVTNDLLTNVTIRNITVSGSSINVSGSCIMDTLTSTSLLGDTVIRMKGNGIFSLTGSGAILRTSLSIESGANTTTIRGNLNVSNPGGAYTNPTISYTSGVVDLTQHTNLSISNVNMNTSGMSWKNINLTAGGSNTLLSTLSATTITPLNGSDIQLLGSYGFVTQNFSWTVISTTQTLFLSQNVEYIVNNSIFARGTSAIRLTFRSSDLTNKSILTVKDSATLDLNYINGTRIDSSSGQTVWVRVGTLTDTINWSQLLNPVTKSTSFIL